MRERRQFLGSFHLAVACENLLDQCRARAWQSHDEDGCRRLIACAGIPFEKLAIEYLDDLVVALFDHHRIVEYLLTLFLVAGVVVVPGPVIVTPVFPRLAEREAEVD